jgi:hypothetical protein
MGLCGGVKYSIDVSVSRLVLYDPLLLNRESADYDCGVRHLSIFCSIEQIIFFRFFLFLILFSLCLENIIVINIHPE